MQYKADFLLFQKKKPIGSYCHREKRRSQRLLRIFVFYLCISQTDACFFFYGMLLNSLGRLSGSGTPSPLSSKLDSISRRCAECPNTTAFLKENQSFERSMSLATRLPVMTATAVLSRSEAHPRSFSCASTNSNTQRLA